MAKQGTIKINVEPKIVAYGVGDKDGYHYDVPFSDFEIDDVFGCATFRIGDNVVTVDRKTLGQLISVLQSMDQELYYAAHPSKYDNEHEQEHF